jgi:hypothetical protein
MWRIAGKTAVDAYVTGLEMKMLGPRSRLTDEQKKQAKAFLDRVRKRYGLDDTDEITP